VCMRDKVLLLLLLVPCQQMLLALQGGCCWG
jgi:hypothetical protein